MKLYRWAKPSVMELKKNLGTQFDLTKNYRIFYEYCPCCGFLSYSNICVNEIGHDLSEAETYNRLWEYRKGKIEVYSRRGKSCDDCWFVGGNREGVGVVVNGTWVSLRDWVRAVLTNSSFSGEDHSTLDEYLDGVDLDEAGVGMINGGSVVTKGGNPFMLLEAALRDDSDYAWGWHCNFAMCIKDNSNLSHAESNRIAAKIMAYFFNIDTTQNPCWDNKWNVRIISDCDKGRIPVGTHFEENCRTVGILWDSGKKRLVECLSGSVFSDHTLDFGNKIFVYEVLQKDALGCDSWQGDRVFVKSLMSSLLRDVLNGDYERIYREIPEGVKEECHKEQIPAPTHKVIAVPREHRELALMGCLGIEEPRVIMGSEGGPIAPVTEVTLRFDGNTLVKHNCYDDAPFILADGADFLAAAGDTLKVSWVCHVWKEVCRTTNNG